jgi:hypothetical protein
MQTRRDLFRLFGVGALIAPVIGGRPEIADAARLLEPPKIVEPTNGEIALFSRGSGVTIRVEILAFGTAPIVLAAKTLDLVWKQNERRSFISRGFEQTQSNFPHSRECMSFECRGDLVSGIVDISK